MIKETEKKHEGLATIKGRVTVFFWKKRCLATKKGESNKEEGGQREATSGGYIQRRRNMIRVNIYRKKQRET